jgi:hypothetical protein
MANGPRVSVREAREKALANEASIVCAYDDESKCRRMLFEGALTLRELEAMLPSLPRNHTIYFYCA